MNERLLLGLDIGTTKVTAVIGELAADRILDVIGEGSAPSEGMKRGVVINLEKTAEAIRSAVRAAERVAGVKVEQAFVGVGGPQLASFTSHGLAAIRRGQTITPADVERAIEQARAFPLEGDHELLHVVPLEFKVDGQEGIHDPVGMTGVRLEVEVLLAAAATGPLANLRRAVQAAGLDIAALVAVPYASGLAVLTPEEAEMNVVVLDIGGGTSSLSYFKGGRLAFAHVLPIGGEHISSDIAKLLKIPFEEAERIKQKYGAAVPELADPDLVLEINQAGHPAGGIPAPELARIIRPRVREIFLLGRKALEEAVGPVEVAASKLVITGGSALLPGVNELARRDFSLPVRLGRPGGVEGLADMVASPAHAVAVGLVQYARQHTEEGKAQARLFPRKNPYKTPASPVWERIKAFFKDFF
jgi:cell division protein FtsA